MGRMKMSECTDHRPTCPEDLTHLAEGVLFFHRTPDDEALAQFRANAKHMPADAIVVDIESCPTLAATYGVNQTPALVYVARGALVAIEFGCDEAACARHADRASMQLRFAGGALDPVT